jgi:L-aminopeptidase/D-esterase-like protein
VITDVAGIRVGHWTNAEARTGCTVVLPPPGSVASGEIRGGAPAERDFALLAPERTVPGADAVAIAGGSAFGLAASDGVARWCEEQGLGLETPAGRVPIVVGMAIFDLMVAEPGVRPTADAGYGAATAASDGEFETGRVGAGAGAMVGGWGGPDRVRPGGLGSASERHGELVVGALVVVNAFGEPIGGGGDRPPLEPGYEAPFGNAAGGPSGNTTVGVIATNARLDKTGCFLAAQSGHDGIARAIEPAHTSFDGDALVCLATGATEAAVDVVRALAARAVERAIHQAFDGA